MIALIQRVTSANVIVKANEIAAIDQGLLALIGVEKSDTQVQADRLLERILGYRIFEDEQGRMNLSVRDISGGLLLVPQFTLVADTKQGMRPGFSSAASPEEGEKWFDYMVEKSHISHAKVAQGEFGADMKVGLINDGPATFWLQV